MRSAVIWLFLTAITVSVADTSEEPWVEEEDVEEPYNEYPEEEPHDRRKREVYVENPYEEHIRVKRRCSDEPMYRVRRSTDTRRVPRQVHQYEVHELTDDFNPNSPPYEEMLAASAEHYHRVYAVPGALKSARFLNPEVSPEVLPIPLAVYRPVQPNNPVQFIQDEASSAASNRAPVKTPLSANSVKLAPGNVFPVNVAPVPASVSHSAAAHALVTGQLPVATVPVAQVKQLSDGDLYGAAAGHYNKHHHGHEGGGHSRHGDHHSHTDGKGSKGYNSGHHSDTGNKGFKVNHLHRKEYEDAKGLRNRHHDKAGHEGSHEEEAFGQRGSNFDEKKGHKKGHKTKGYHNKYHKDEYHKEHKFYDDFHKGGEHHRYGKFNAKHASDESGKKQAHHVNAGHDFVERGKKGYSNKGHVDSDNKGYNGKSGHEEHHDHHSDHGKKGGKDGGSQWGYAKKQ